MKRPQIYAILLFSILVLTLFSCKKNREPDPPGEPESPVDIYAAGREGYVAKYWKNKVPVVLGSGSGSSDARAMVVSGKDVYVAGFQINAAGKYVATYWKNGIATFLTDGSRDAYANSIILNGGDIYIAGQELSSGRFAYQAKYWKNGNPVVLSDETQSAIATDIAMLGNDIYVIGERREDPWLTPITCYWKNGQLNDLSDRTTAAGNQSIITSGSDLYMAWSVTYNNSGQSRIYYAKNLASPVLINDGNADNRLESITVDGNDVYLAGYAPSMTDNLFSAKYWKNGSPVTLADITESTFCLTLAVTNGDIYAAGFKDGPRNGGYGNALYWENGKLIMLTDGSQSANINKIIVIRK